MPYRKGLPKYAKSVSLVLKRRDIVLTREVGHPGYLFPFAVGALRVGHDLPQWCHSVPFFSLLDRTGLVHDNGPNCITHNRQPDLLLLFVIRSIVIR